MDDRIKIKLNYQKDYSYGAYHAGFDLFDSMHLENLENTAFYSLKIRIDTIPNVLLENECTVDFLAPFGNKTLSCDFLKMDLSSLAEKTLPTEISVFITVTDPNGEVIFRSEMTSRFLPYHYFCGLGKSLETLAFYTTPRQEELSLFDSYLFPGDPVASLKKIYEMIKEMKINYDNEDLFSYSGYSLRLPEKVLEEKAATALEMALLFNSVCERAGFSPLICLEGKNRIYCGITLKFDKLPLIWYLGQDAKDLEGLLLLDAAYLAYGSEMDFDTALFHSKNKLSLTDERITTLSVSAARRYHLIPIPCRLRDGSLEGVMMADHSQNADRFADFYAFRKDFSSDPKISALLTGKKISVDVVQKVNFNFEHDLDVNQNKVLQKIRQQDLTMILAQTGSGVSTVFARAAAQEVAGGKKVLYITDPSYHASDFQKILSDEFDPSFCCVISEGFSVQEKFAGIFEDHEGIFEDQSKMLEALKDADGYYADLEGNKKIVSSFLFAADRYNQLRHVNDSINFSPEQIGMLTDEVVHSWFRIVNEAVRVLNEVGSVCGNPLSLIRCRDFSYEYKSKLIEKLEEILHVIEKLTQLRDQISNHFPSMEGIRPLWALKAFNDLTALFSDFKQVPISFFENPIRIEESFRKVTELIQAKKENDVISQTIRISFDEKIFDLDAKELNARYRSLQADKGFKILGQKHAILKSVKKYLRPNCDVENMEYILSRLDQYQRNLELIRERQESAFRLLSVSMDGENGWTELAVATDLCYQGYYIFQNYFSAERLFDFVTDFAKAIDSYGIKDKFSELRILEKHFRDSLSELDQIVQNQTERVCLISEGDYFSEIYRSLTTVLSSVDNVKAWCSWLNVRENALENGMKNMVLAIENGKVSADELKKSFLRAFFKAVCEFNFIDHPKLNSDRYNVGDSLEQFEASFAAYRSKKRAQLNSILSSQYFENAVDDDRDPRTLLREDPLAFFSRYPCVIADRKEALRYFSSYLKHFDLILIEDRSELLLSDMLWTLSAGKKVAFAGSFSHAWHRNPKDLTVSDPAFDYLWHLVDDKQRLSVTYRSTPSMTAFKASYAGGINSHCRCYSIPGTSSSMPVQLHRVAGSFGTEVAGANVPEAQFVVETVIRRMMEDPERSVSVIAGTSEQKMLILRLLAQKMRFQDELAERLRAWKQLSVCAIGEELIFADSVIFSATFAPDRSRHSAGLPYAFLEFGGTDPKKEILNVLSSAKESVTLITSFGYDELRHTETVLPAVYAFLMLLEGANSLPANNTYSLVGLLEESSITKSVGDLLEKEGYRVLYGVRSGRFYLDLVLTDETGEFILGVVSDQTVLSQTSHVSAIEIAQTRLYEKHGWRLYRLSSPLAFDSIESEVRKILDLLPKKKDELDLI